MRNNANQPQRSNMKRRPGFPSTLGVFVAVAVSLISLFVFKDAVRPVIVMDSRVPLWFGKTSFNTSPNASSEKNQRPEKDDEPQQLNCKLEPIELKSSHCQERKVDASSELAMCVGIRDSGPRFVQDFSALALIVEKFGPINGVAGGGSASISSFVLESIESNPLVLTCGRQACCTALEQRARISFLLKSMEYITSVLDMTGERTTKQILKSLISLLPKNLDQDIDIDAAIDMLTFDKSIRDVVNPDVIRLLETSNLAQYHLEDILHAEWEQLAVSQDFLSLVRPHLLAPEAILSNIDIAASFLAGKEPLDMQFMESILQDCSLASLSRDWSDIQDLSIGDQLTCGEMFEQVFAKFMDARKGSHPSRLNDNLGETLRTLIPSAILLAEGKDTWEKAVKDYEEVKDVTLPIDFADFRIGYHGDSASLRAALRNLRSWFSDAKSRLVYSLGPTTWRQALLSSLASPRLSRGVLMQDILDTIVSFGGWVDPAPSQVLNAMGCSRVILINRPGEIDQQSVDIPLIFGAYQETMDALYSLEGDSSLAEALQHADATVCIDADMQFQTDHFSILSNDSCILSLDVGTENNKEVHGCFHPNTEERSSVETY